MNFIVTLTENIGPGTLALSSRSRAGGRALRGSRKPLSPAGFARWVRAHARPDAILADPPAPSVSLEFPSGRLRASLSQRQQCKCLLIGSTDRGKELGLMRTYRNVRGVREATKVDGRLVLKPV